ncbi:MAG: glycosyltransferase family 9 protein [Gemmatimonadaceae bacterium]|nr:glycosyltransferase family 9 protein [Gemmatimonadaceae bacterium]
MTSSLIVQTSFIGDAVLTTPLIAELARRGPVSLVVTRAAAALFAHHPGVSRVIVYDKRGADAGVRGFQRMVRALRTDDRQAVAYLAQGSHRSGLLARAAGYRERVGFATSTGRLWYTTRITPTDGLHHADRLWRLARSPDAPTADQLRPRLYPAARDEARVEVLLNEHGALGEPLIALAPGSVWATKRWPFFPALARDLSALGRVVVLGSEADSALARDIAAASPSAIDATGQLSLLGSAALIARARVLVTNDSAPLHLASAMNTPTVAIFGPTVTRFGFGPLAQRSSIAEVSNLACRPCSAHGPATCPLGHFRCMLDLLPDRVLMATTALLNERR